jgi:O-antigen/teichoic acid export membrane protein
MSREQDRSGLKFFKSVTGVFSIELITLPLGLLVAIVLTRRLGPEIYGLYVLAIAVVFWLEMISSFMMNSATEYYIATTQNWRPVGSLVLRVHLIMGFAGGALLFIAAPAAAWIFNQPGLIAPLRLLALDIPIFGLAVAHRNILVGLGRYTPRAFGPLGRWLVRLATVLVLLELGLGINSAVLGIVAGSLAELIVYRYFVRPPLGLKPSIALKSFVNFATPLLLQSIALNLHRHLDLIMLGVLVASSYMAGIYGAALNLCLPIKAVSLALTPLLTSDLSRLYQKGHYGQARQRVRQAWKVIFWLLPLCAAAGASAPDLVVLLFGPAYAEGAGALAWLLFASWASLAIDIGSAMLVALARPRLALASVVWLPPAALAGHLLLIPVLGGLGAAIATTLTTGAGFIVIAVMVNRAWQVILPSPSLLKSILVSAALLAAGWFWSMPGFWVLLKLVLLAAPGAMALVACKEFSPAQLWRALAVITGREVRAVRN